MVLQETEAGAGLPLCMPCLHWSRCAVFVGRATVNDASEQPKIRLIAGEIQWCIPFYPGSHVFMSSCPSTLEYLIFFQLETQRRTLMSPQDQNFRKYVMHDQNFGSFW